jgi:hypothetical protein
VTYGYAEFDSVLVAAKDINRCKVKVPFWMKKEFNWSILLKNEIDQLESVIADYFLTQNSEPKWYR